MTLTRRQFMASTAAAALVPTSGFSNTDFTPLVARAAKAQIAPDSYPKTRIWGYDGGVPGPTIRVPQGARIQRKLVNELPQETAVHWHGLRLNNAMDGVPDLTQTAVKQGATFNYDFIAPDAGTYWYHSHNQSTEQVARGLYGVLIVDEDAATRPDVDHDITVLLDDWRLTQQAQITDDFGQMHDWSHGGRTGNFIHARLFPNVPALQQNQRLRLRFINVATDRIMQIGLRGMTGHIVALDGMPLIAPIADNQMVLAPAQRVDFIVDVTAASGDAAQIVLQERDQILLLAEVAIDGQHSAAPRPKPAALPANPIPYLTDVAGARTVPLVMTGGAMGGLRQALYQGRMLDTRALVDNGQIWAFNGVAGMTDRPLTTVAKGETIRIPIRNDTVFSHAMHIHGNHFQQLRGDGTLGPLRDTILVQPNETTELVMRGENAGDWLFHCHMLSHQASGMKTWIKVEA